MSVVVVADASRSVPATQRVQAQAWLAERAKDRPDPADRIGVVTVAKTPEIRSLPSRSGDVDITSHAGDGTATDLAAGLRAAIAVMPADAMHRILLLSDGVDTSGDTMEAAARAATLGIPVDVATLSSPNMGDVMVESLRTPARARRGQVIDARVVVRASQACEGRLRLRVDDRPVDLDPRGNSDAMVVKLQAGPNAFNVPLPVDRSGAVRVEAYVEAVDARQNAIVENDRGSSITFVSGEGRVLVVDDGGGSGVEALVQAVRASQLDVEVCGTEGLSRRVASGDFEGIVLVNVPRWSVDADTDRALHASVQGMGCGLMMVGGDHGFGAGGWKDSETAKALPVDMDPPQERKLPAGALALIIDCSGSMASPVAGTGVSQQQIAAEAAIKAIRALSALDEVTVIAFSGDAALSVPLTELAKSHATTKHAIVLTDGQTMGEPSVGMALAQRMASEGVTLSTLAIGDGSNDGLLARLAKAANGRFYAVKDDQSRVAIPQIFIKEAQLVRRSLVWEGQPFEPRRIGTADWMRSISAVPSLRGYVLTGARGEPAQIGLVSAGDPPDPILAWWNHGLGRGVAFTSDLGGRWTPAWATWPGFQPFVGGMVRWMLRPTAPGDVLVRSRLEGDEAIVEVEAVGDTAARVQSAEARVMQP
ncbi:MAG: VWA domain-containing protein, partial [Planctomycetaceae bacterium]|nr:VWA domain-containing protein [Planctomycetaceae bacterium]